MNDETEVPTIDAEQKSATELMQAAALVFLDRTGRSVKLIAVTKTKRVGVVEDETRVEVS